MKTNQEKAAEAKIKVGNRYTQILLDNFQELRGKFKRDNNMFSSGYIKAELKDLTCSFKIYPNRGGDYSLEFKTDSKNNNGFSLYFEDDGGEEKFKSFNDKVKDYPNSAELITFLKEEWERIGNEEREEMARKRLINLEKQFAELNVIFPQE